MNSKATKTLSVVSAMILTLLIVLTMVLSACSVPTVIPETPPEIDKPVYDGALTEEDEEMEQDKVYELSENITFLSTSAESNTLNNGINLSATVLPENATSTELDWTVSWNTSDSRYTEEFNNTNPISDYATITPNAENTHLAVLVCLKAFPVPIELKVQSREYTNKFAKCQLDFAKKIIDFAYGLGVNKIIGNADKPIPTRFILASIVAGKENGEVRVLGSVNYNYENIPTNTFDIQEVSEVEWSIGTIEDVNVELESLACINTTIAGAYLREGYIVSTEVANEIYGLQTIGAHSAILGFNDMNISRWIGDGRGSSRWNAFVRAFENSTKDIRFEITLRSKYSSKSMIFYAEFDDIDRMKVAIASININNENLIFQ